MAKNWFIIRRDGREGLQPPAQGRGTRDPVRLMICGLLSISLAGCRDDPKDTTFGSAGHGDLPGSVSPTTDTTPLESPDAPR